MRKGLIVLSVVVLITSCAYPTHYHRESRLLGYSDSKITGNEYEVVFKANNDTKVERLNDFVLLRAAEVTIKNGFKYFTLVSTQYTSEVKKAPRAQFTTNELEYQPTVYIKNDNDYCEPINLDGNKNSDVLIAEHNVKNNSMSHDRFDSRIPSLKDINSIHKPIIEKIDFYTTVNKSIIKLSNNSTRDAKNYRADDIIKNITSKYNIVR